MIDGSIPTSEQPEDADVMQQLGPLASPLLPGEQFDAVLPIDVDHWIAVYEELTGFLRGLHHHDPETLERYQRQLGYWRARRNQMGLSG